MIADIKKKTKKTKKNKKKNLKKLKREIDKKKPPPRDSQIRQLLHTNPNFTEIKLLSLHAFNLPIIQLTPIRHWQTTQVFAPRALLHICTIKIIN
jgi:hypothetical protein